MQNFALEEISEAHRALLSTLHKCEKINAVKLCLVFAISAGKTARYRTPAAGTTIISAKKQSRVSGVIQKPGY